MRHDREVGRRGFLRQISAVVFQTRFKVNIIYVKHVALYRLEVLEALEAAGCVVDVGGW